MHDCCFLTMDDLGEFFTYDELLVEPLAKLGWSVDFISWRNRNANWNKYEAVVIRSPWDYQDDPELFIEVLEEVDASTAQLENKLEIVKWNLSKTYLKDMEQRGVRIVPSLWYNHWNDLNSLPALFSKLNADQLIIKPLISANADHTYWLKQRTFTERVPTLKEVFSNRPFMVQPFIENILEEGEYSLFYFGGSYSHAILKTPKAGDFRVQEEHGGQLKTVEPNQKLLEAGEKAVSHIYPDPLYVRADYVRVSTGHYALMELELIEPSLYFNMDPESPERFARVFNRWMKEQ